MFRNIPFLLLLLIIVIAIICPIMPVGLKQFLYSLSLTIKEFITFLLPIIIFGLLFKAAVSIANKATKIIGLILVLVCCSNFLSTFLSHFIGVLIYNFDLSMLIPKEEDGLKPLWNFTLPNLIANNYAMFIGIIFGMVASKFCQNKAIKIADYIEHFISKIINCFSYIIPFFMIGFITKMADDGVISSLLKNYSLIFIFVALSQYSYIGFVYLILNKFNFSSTVANIKNMLPAAIAGFSTMSSAASMPLTLKAVEANSNNKALAKSVVPATVNIHLVGDCFAIPIFAYAVLKSFGHAEPYLTNYLVFTAYFVLAKFSVAAVPGGGIIVMLPILEKYLGFDAEMLSMITMLYILFDPVITSANVFGNGAFTKLIDRVFARGNSIS